MFDKVKFSYFCFSIAFIFIACSQICYSSVKNINAHDFVKSVNNTIDKTIPAVDEVVPGYQASSGTLPSLLIGDFSGETEYESSLGMALGDILRFDISAETADQLLMPAYETFQRDWHSAFYGVDKQNRLTGLKRLADMWGIENVVDGKISVKGGEFAWRVTIKDIKTGTVLASKAFKGKLEQLPDAIKQVEHFVLMILLDGATGGRGEESTSEVGSLTKLNKYAEFLSFRNKHGKEDVLRRSLSLWEAGFHMPAVGVAILQYLRTDFNKPGFYDDTMSSVNSKFRSPNFEAFYFLQRGLYTHSLNTGFYIDKLKSLARNYPDDPEILLSLCQLMEQRGEELNALGILRKMVLRWPNIFYIWSTESYTIYNYSWLIRGRFYWNQVPEEAKSKFLTLIDLAKRSAENCYLVSHGHPVCISAELNAQIGYSDKLLKLFDAATDIEPFVERPYFISLVYAADKWGGNRQAREYIIKKARKNNPDAEWVEKLRIKYAPEVGGRSHYILITLAVVILIMGGFVINRRFYN